MFKRIREYRRRVRALEHHLVSTEQRYAELENRVNRVRADWKVHLQLEHGYSEYAVNDQPEPDSTPADKGY